MGNSKSNPATHKNKEELDALKAIRDAKFCRKEQSHKVLERLKVTFEENDSDTATDIVKLITDGLIPFDPSATFRGAIQLRQTEIISTFRRVVGDAVGDFYDDSSYEYCLDIDGIKPYVLAYVFTVSTDLARSHVENPSRKWRKVFAELVRVSRWSLTDSAFGITILRYLLWERVSSGNSGRAWGPRIRKPFPYDRDSYRTLLRGLTVPGLLVPLWDPISETYREADLIEYLIGNDYHEILEDVLTVADCGTMLVDRDYLGIEARPAGDNLPHTRYLEILSRHGQHVLGGVGPDVYLRTAIRLYRLDHILWYLERDFGAEALRTRDAEGRLPLRLMFERIDSSIYERDSERIDSCIKRMIERGPDSEEVATLVEYLFDEYIYRLAGKVAVWLTERKSQKVERLDLLSGPSGPTTG